MCQEKDGNTAWLPRRYCREVAENMQKTSREQAENTQKRRRKHPEKTQRRDGNRVFKV
jgi:hypothetical protein